MKVDLSVEEEGSGSSEQVSVEVDEGATVEQVLDAADLNPETVLVEHDGRIVPKGETVPGQELRILQVISGG